MNESGSAGRLWRRPAATARRLMHLFLVLALAGPGAACARLFGGYDLAPNGLTRQEERVRRLLADGRADSLHAALEAGRLTPPEDRLLADLYRGVAALYGGDPATSAALLDSAAYLADDRQTRSISRAAASFLSSDRTLEWIPSPTERLLVPYFAAHAWLARGDVEGAAVEARRLSALLEEEEDPPAQGLPLRAALRYFAGAVFEAAGAHNDAGVAYRNAAAVSATVLPAVDSAPPVPGQGEVLVVLERGFVAHRVERSFNVVLEAPEIHALTEGHAGQRLAAATLVAGWVLMDGMDGGQTRRGRALGTRRVRLAEATRDACAAGVGSGVIHPPGGDTARASTPADTCGAEGDGEGTEEESDTPYLLRVAWPAYVETPLPGGPGAATVQADGTPAVGVAGGGSVSASLTADFDRNKLELVARTLARAAAKAAVSRGVEKEMAEKDETAGAILGILTNVGTALLERADTRGWNLLPGQIGLARLRLPAGAHHLQVTLDGDRVLDLGTVEVTPGTVRIVPARAW